MSDDDLVLVHDLARSVIDAQRMLAAWPRVTQHALHADAEPYRSAVTLVAGSLPGSALVSAGAAAPGPDRRGSRLARLRLDAPAQFAIRVTLAAGAAATLGSVLSERRYYWAVLAVFVTYMGANTSGEQVTKAAWRIIGTLVGILIGGLLANVIGHSTWSLAIIILALATGTIFMKANYAVMVVGLTIAISQLYAQLGEYSNHLLVMRLEENAIGAAIGALAAIWIFPVSTRRATAIAARGYLSALAELLDRISEHVGGQADTTSLSAAVRGLDAAHHQLHTTAYVKSNLQLFTAVSHQARTLVDDVAAGPYGDAPGTQNLQHELARVRNRTKRLTVRLRTQPDPTAHHSPTLALTTTSRRHPSVSMMAATRQASTASTSWIKPSPSWHSDWKTTIRTAIGSRQPRPRRQTASDDMGSTAANERLRPSAPSETPTTRPNAWRPHGHAAVRHVSLPDARGARGRSKAP
jgi:hypothetical protein